MRECRFCGKTGLHEVVDLHFQPASNSFLTREQLRGPEMVYPLKVYVCDACWLMQLPESKEADKIFKEDYPYYSSQSPANVSHAKEYVDMMVERFPYLGHVLEIGSNDGYMLQWFKEKGHCVSGIDPAKGPGDTARNKGIPTFPGFFSRDFVLSAQYKGSFGLICGINVLAHQPDINDFVEGLQIALRPTGVVTMEFPHLMCLIDECQFDTIYHEHYNYLSFTTVCEIFRRHGLEMFDVQELSTHGGSLRVFAQHRLGPHERCGSVTDLLEREQQAGVRSLAYYRTFRNRVQIARKGLVLFLLNAAEVGMIGAYGAAAKGNTLLNYCGIRSDLVRFVADRSPHKQDKFLPGSHIPVVSEEYLKDARPDYVLILPWNLKEEIMQQLSYIKRWGGRFIIPIPGLEVY